MFEKSSLNQHSLEAMAANPLWIRNASLLDYTVDKGVKMLGTLNSYLLEQSFKAKSHEIKEAEKEKRWINNLISRVNDLASRSDKDMGTVSLALPKKGTLFQEERNLQLAHRITVLIEELATKEGALDLADPKIDKAYKEELLEKLREAAAFGYELPEGFAEGSTVQLDAGQVKQVLSEMRVKSGASNEDTWKDLRHRLEVRKLLREAQQKGYISGRYGKDRKYDLNSSDLVLTKEEKSDLITQLKDDVQAGIQQTITHATTEADRLFQTRHQLHQLIQMVLKRYDEAMSATARKIGGR